MQTRFLPLPSWSSSLRATERLFPGIQSSVKHWIKVNSQLLHCAFFPFHWKRIHLAIHRPLNTWQKSYWHKELKHNLWPSTDWTIVYSVVVQLPSRVWLFATPSYCDPGTNPKKPRLKIKSQGFPGSSVVKHPPANAGDMGLISDSGRSHMLWSNKSHKPQLLSWCSRAWEPQPLSPCTTTIGSPCPRAHAQQQEKLPQWEAHAVQLESSPCSPQLEKTHTATKTQHSQK